jgi:SpoVK/Ycf46/Vps4 family AAA+-type ATPase
LKGQDHWVNDCAPPGAQMPPALDNTSEPLQLLKHMQENNKKTLFLLKDFAKHLDDATIARHFREVAQLFSQTRSAMVLCGVNINLPPELDSDAVHFDLPMPTKEELFQAISEVIRSLRLKNQIQVELQEREMQVLVQSLVGMTLKQARQAVAYAALKDGKLSIQDIGQILERKARVIHEGGVLEYFPLDERPLSVGGFNGLKQWLLQARAGFSPQAQELNLKPPKGILIIGVQGCGKSLTAKAIARAWKLPLLKLDTGRLYDKYIGESERNFRQAIRLAESMSPTVLWIDEIEKAFGSMDSDADGGLSRRMFGFFLTWMQEKSQEVFVVATANNISQLPPELLRKGRFDEIFFVDLPDSQERQSIWQIHLTQRKQQPERFDLESLVQASEGFSGAEIEQIVITALYRSLHLKQALDTPLLLEGIKTTIPLSVARREDLQQLRAIAEERFVSVR